MIGLDVELTVVVAPKDHVGRTDTRRLPLTARNPGEHADQGNERMLL
ncbi:MAG: hypothetical protein ACLP8S_30025 [Solirubrobacteraceae bacterium]